MANNILMSLMRKVGLRLVIHALYYLLLADSSLLAAETDPALLPAETAVVFHVCRLFIHRGKQFFGNE